MVYDLRANTVELEKPWFLWLKSDCVQRVYKTLENKQVSASFYDLVFVHKYSTRTQFSLFIDKFCESEGLQSHRFKALECDQGDFLKIDSYLINNIKSDHSAKAYCLLQEEGVRFSSEIYSPDLIDRINTEARYEALQVASEDGCLTCSEINEVVGCICSDNPNPCPNC